MNIVISGPESSGKTTLANSLAQELQFRFVPEFCVDFLNDLGRPYDFDDLAVMSKGQYELINSIPDDHRIIDTAQLNYRIWGLDKFQEVDDFTQKGWINFNIDLCILCTPDIPWQYDELRENPLDRDRLFEWYKEELSKVNYPYIIVKGPHDQRKADSLAAIHKIIL